MRRIGLMCGTFDPPHIGHLILAQTALSELALDQVLFLPVGDPTHKTTRTPAVHRLRMTELAIQDNPGFILDHTDAIRPEPHYTATLLPIIKQKFPQTKLWLLVGGDSVATFPDWHQPAEILSHCRLAVLDRPKVDTKITPSTTLRNGLVAKIDQLTGPSVDLSSTWLRSQFKQYGKVSGEAFGRYLVPSNVSRYIVENELY